MARPREAVGCRTLICRKADSGQLNDLAFITGQVGQTILQAALHAQMVSTVNSSDVALRPIEVTVIGIDVDLSIGRII